MNTVKIAAIHVIGLLLASSACADQLGGFAGRTVNVEDSRGTSIEAFYKSFEGTAIGVRASYRYNENIIVFGDYAKTEADFEDGFSADGLSFGAGLLYLQPDLIEGYDAAIKVSYHTGNLSNDSVSFAAASLFSVDVDTMELAAQLIISSQETLTESGLKWYAGLGAHQLKTAGSIGPVDGGNTTINNVSFPVDLGSSSTEFGFSAGLVYPLSFGQAFAAYENIDGGIFGGGIRYYLK